MSQFDGTITVKMSLDSSGLEGQLAKVQQSFQSFAGDLADISAKAGNVGNALLDPVKNSLRIFTGFDDAMLAVKAVVTKDFSNEGFAALTEQAKELGRTTSWTTEEVANGMVQIGRATGSIERTGAMITGVMNAARATGTGIENTARYVNTTLNQFGLSADQADHVADVMVATANSSAQTLTDLGEALSYCGANAKATGYSLEDTVKIIGLLANVGITGSRAGTVLSNMMQRMQSQPGQVRKELEELNFDPIGENGALKSIPQLITEILEATDGARLADRNRFFGILFGQRAMPGVSGLANLPKEAFSEMAAAVDGASGAAEKGAREMDSGLGGACRLMKSAIDGIKISIAEGLSPTLVELTEKITPLLTKVAEFISNHPIIVKAVAGIGAAFAGLSTSTFIISRSIGLVSSGLEAVVGVAKLLSKINVVGAMDGLVTALSSLGKAGIIGAVVAVSVGVLALAANLFSAQAQAKRLNEELANMTGENNKIRKEDFQKYQALINLERQGELSPENLAIAKSALEDLQKTYGDLGITIEGNRVIGASEGFEGFKGKVRESYQADIQKQRDALQKQIAATEKEVSNDEYMSMNADNAPAKRTAVWVQRKLGISSDWNDVKELKEQEAALAQQQKDADIFFGTALGGSKQEVYEQLAIGAGGGMDANAIIGAIQSGVQGVTDVKVEAPAGPVAEAGKGAAETAESNKEIVNLTKRSNDYLQIMCDNMIGTPVYAYAQ